MSDRYTELLTQSRAAPGIKCVQCGRFIAEEAMRNGTAKHHFEPLSEYGPEVSEWLCGECE